MGRDTPLSFNFFGKVANFLHFLIFTYLGEPDFSKPSKILSLRYETLNFSSYHSVSETVSSSAIKIIRVLEYLYK